MRDLLAGFGLITIAALATECIRSYLDAKLPDNVPPPRPDDRDTRAKWDRIQGR
jgi:hypothetical protein